MRLVMLYKVMKEDSEDKLTGSIATARQKNLLAIKMMSIQSVLNSSICLSPHHLHYPSYRVPLVCSQFGRI